MKVIAMYLPQFHRTPENDEWWGEGFTEWTAVRNAKPIFEGHNQPRIPLDERYYDLLDKNTMIWQSELMHKYGIDGMCIYHYWFKNGRRILEKPVENLLKWKDIDMPFCLCWANETWARSWSNIGTKNTWAENFEIKKRTNESEILLEQQYGLEEQWKQHFEYLLPFFKDERYICVDGKPVFVIYHAWEIVCLPVMIDYWRNLAKENGLKGIHIIGALTEDHEKYGLDAGLTHEPVHAKKLIDKNGKGNHVYSYNELWNNIIDFKDSGKIYYGGFVSYDDTPRRGKNGWYVEDFSVETFKKNIEKLILKNQSFGNELLFLNAWNEWGEGMFLEPDVEFKFRKLEAIRSLKDDVFEKKEIADKIIKKENNPIIRDRNKFERYMHVLSKWMTLRENGFKIEEWLKRKHIYSVAVYGYGILGKHFTDEILKSDIKLSYVIDKNKINIDLPIDIYTPDEVLPMVDAVVVCASFFFEEIYSEIKDKVHGRIISLEQIIREPYE